jgi:hypothetical protein
MNKKNIIVLCVVVVALAIIGIFVWDKKTARAPGVSTTITTSTTTSPATSSPSSTGSGLSVVVSTSSPKKYSNASFSLTYAGAWTIANHNNPFTLTNFGGKYLNGGILPAGGAEIDVVTTTVEGNLQDIIAYDLQGTTNIATTTISVDGVPCSATADHSAYTPGYTSKNVSVYCQQGIELWKIYLSYDANDTTSTSPLPAFNAMLASMKFFH